MFVSKCAGGQYDCIWENLWMDPGETLHDAKP